MVSLKGMAKYARISTFTRKPLKPKGSLVSD
jgi:hypothetical protein